MLVAVIPAMNQPQIGSIVRRTQKYVDHVIVVDEEDAHIDTAKLAARAGAYSYYSNGGCLRAAVELGFAKTGPHDDVVTLDGDGAQRPGDIPALLDVGADVVIGSRFVPNGHFLASWVRYIVDRAYSLACRWRTGLKASDFGGGFRLYRNGTARQLLGNQCRGHAWQAEILARAHRRGLSIAEVPVTTRASGTTLNAAAVLEGLRLLTKI